MLQRYWGGERDVWRVVHVPTVAVEDARHASRALMAVTRVRTIYRPPLAGMSRENVTQSRF